MLAELALAALLDSTAIQTPAAIESRLTGHAPFVYGIAVHSWMRRPTERSLRHGRGNDLLAAQVEDPGNGVLSLLWPWS